MNAKIIEAAKSLKSAAGAIVTVVVVIFGAGMWASNLINEVKQLRKDQAQQSELIIESINHQTTSISELTKTLADHETRLAVSEALLEELRKKQK